MLDDAPRRCLPAPAIVLTQPLAVTPPRPAPGPPAQAPAGPTAGALALLTPHGVQALPSRGAVIVGSGPEADCVLPGPGVASAHCAVERGPDGALWVRDLGSPSGTWRRGQRLERARLVEGDALLVGREPVLVVRAGFDRWPDAVRWQGLIARAAASQATLTAIARVAPFELPVLVRGESGVGKELVARAIHAVSERAGGPWVALNCAALTDTLAEATLFGVRRGAFTGATQDRPGVFAEAHGGTLLLDEVGELSPALQAKLLRVLEAREVTPLGEVHPRPVDVRVIAATWRDLDAECHAGRFRHDLWHRLSVLHVDVPPLRARPADVGPLYTHFRAAAPVAGPPPTGPELEELARRPWPGNARELRNAALRDAVLGPARRPGEPPGAGTPPGEGLAAGWIQRPGVARHEITGRRAGRGRGGAWRIRHETQSAQAATAVWRAGGNRALAARSLGVSRSTLYRWLRHARVEPGRSGRPVAVPGPPWDGGPDSAASGWLA